VRFLIDLITFTNIHLNALPIYADILLKDILLLRKENISILIYIILILIDKNILLLILFLHYYF